MKKSILVLILFLVGSLATACGSGNDSTADKEIVDESVNIKELVADLSSGKRQAESASITSHQLMVKENGKETVYDLPSEEFFLSIAPFIESTHP